MMRRSSYVSACNQHPHSAHLSRRCCSGFLSSGGSRLLSEVRHLMACRCRISYAAMVLLDSPNRGSGHVQLQLSDIGAGRLAAGHFRSALSACYLTDGSPVEWTAAWWDMLLQQCFSNSWSCVRSLSFKVTQLSMYGSSWLAASQIQYRAAVG